MVELKRRYAGILILVVVLALGFTVSTSLGTVTVPFRDTLRIVVARFTGAVPEGIPSSHYNIIVKIRVPRVLLGMVVGASLSVSGLVFQALLRNPLADPYTLGISAGASFGAGLAIFLSYLLHP